MNRKSEKILKGEQQIMEYINVSRPTLRELLKSGLPAQKLGTQWFAHADNIEQFFRDRTAISGRSRANKPGLPGT